MVTWDDGSGGGKKQLESGYFLKMEPIRPANVLSGRRCCSVAKLCLTLQPHGLQHTLLPCPSISPGVFSNSCPLSRWCHPTISSSVARFSSCPQSFLAWESFQMSQLFTSGGQSIGSVSVSVSVLPVKIQGWLSLELTGWSPSRNSQGSSPAPQFESINSSVLSLLNGPTLISVQDYWKNHSFDYMDLCQQSYISAF